MWLTASRCVSWTIYGFKAARSARRALPGSPPGTDAPVSAPLRAPAPPVARLERAVLAEVKTPGTGLGRSMLRALSSHHGASP